MIKKDTNVTYVHTNQVFEKVYSDTYKIRHITSGVVYDEAVNISVDENDYEETNILLSKEEE